VFYGEIVLSLQATALHFAIQRTIQRTMRADYQPFAPFIVWVSACK
jgi:hypothetical protein